MNSWLAPVFFVQEMPARAIEDAPPFQYDGHAAHCVLGSVLSNSHNSVFAQPPKSCSDSGQKGLNDWFCRTSCWRACRFWWFSIFWINSRTLVLYAYFTTEYGSPGISKSMSASILPRGVSSSMLSVPASWYTWRSSCTATVSLTGRPVLSWVCSTLRLLLSSDERAWISSVSTDRPVLSEETVFFVRRIHTDLLGTGRFSFILHLIKSPWCWSWLG